MGGRAIRRTDWAEFVSESVKGDHSLLAMASKEQRMNRLCVAIVDDGPEAESAYSAMHMAAHERERIIPFGLKDRETLLGCNTDVGFEHDPCIARTVRSVQLPMFQASTIPAGGGVRLAMQTQCNLTISVSNSVIAKC